MGQSFAVTGMTFLSVSALVALRVFSMSSEQLRHSFSPTAAFKLQGQMRRINKCFKGMSAAGVLGLKEEKTLILLLKTKSVPVDVYEEYFSTNIQYQTQFVPVLEHHFNDESLQELQVLVMSGAFQQEYVPEPSVNRYGGIIFTSQRAVEAFSKVVKNLRQVSRVLDKLLPSVLPLYVVGPATARGLNALNLKCAVVGENSGNGEALATFILDHYGQSQATNHYNSQAHLPLLFLVGEQRRDIIPKTLQSEDLPLGKHIPVTEMTIYETGVMESFPGHFATLVEPNIRRGVLFWVVIFSPTGCMAMLEILGLLNSGTGQVNPQASSLSRKTLIATIGPTTRNYLVRQFGFEPDVCASKPSHESIGDAIQKFMLEEQQR